MQQGYNFTERVWRVLAMAREEAVRLRHEYTGTEHLLLGLLREEKGLAAQVLNGAGVTVETARVEMQRILGTSPLDGDASRLDRSSSGADEMGRMVVNGMRAFLAPRGDRPAPSEIVVELRYPDGRSDRRECRTTAEAMAFLLGH
jgi:ATP-dependent Clp protease ATP-binding subunit ClpA